MTDVYYNSYPHSVTDETPSNPPQPRRRKKVVPSIDEVTADNIEEILTETLELSESKQKPVKSSRRSITSKRNSEQELPLSETHSKSSRRRQSSDVYHDKRKKSLKEDDMDASSRRDALEETNGQNSASRKRRSRKGKEKREKDQIFTSRGHSRVGEIQLTLAEDGILWSLTAGHKIDKNSIQDEHPHLKDAVVHTIPYQHILCIRRSIDSAKGNRNRLQATADADEIPCLEENAHPKTTFGNAPRSSFIVDYVKENNQKLRPEVWEVTLDSEVECCQWVKYLNNIIKKNYVRPKKVRVYVPLHKASSHARAVQTFCEKALPLAEKLDVLMELVEGSPEISSLLLDFEKHNVSISYDAIAVVGDDCAIVKVVTALMNYSQKLAGHIIRPQFTPAACRLPLAIFPFGLHSDIATSILGTDDFITAVLHFLLGNKVPVNIGSTFSKDVFIGWNFSWMYGFAALCEGALMRKGKTQSDLSLTSEFHAQLKKHKQLTAYECEIQYILADGRTRGDILDRQVCTRDCRVCSAGGKESASKENIQCEEVEEFNGSEASQASEDVNMLELRGSDKWHVLKGTFVWIGVHALPCRNHIMSPMGMSRYGHLHHGCVDLILVHPCKTKDFMRFLRRHGEALKNPLQFPFVECHRVSAVRITSRMPHSWTHCDLNKSEIDYYGSGTSALRPTSAIITGSRSSFSGSGVIRETSAGSIGRNGRVLLKSTNSNQCAEAELVIDDFASDDDGFDHSSSNKEISSTRVPFSKPPLGSPAVALRRALKLSPNVRDSPQICRVKGSAAVSSSLLTLPSSVNGGDPSVDESSLAGDWFLNDTHELSSDTEANVPHSRKPKFSSTSTSGKPTSPMKLHFRGDSTPFAEEVNEMISEDIPEARSTKKRSSFFGAGKLIRRLSKSLKTTQAGDGDGEEVTYVRPNVATWEVERRKRQEKQRRKEEKERLKEEARMKCPWLLDHEVHNDLSELRINVHTDVLEIYGHGIAAGSKFPDLKLHWLPLL